MLPTKRFNTKLSLSLLSILLTSCGYQATSGANNNQTVISIPVIHDDDDGVLRNSLAKAISETGKFKYSSEPQDNQLIVKFVNNYTDTIGYSWDINPATGAAVNRLYPGEGRKSIVANITLKNSKSKDPVLEPFNVTFQATYDYVNPVSKKQIEFKDKAGKTHSTLQYSLGQLDSEEGARLESANPLYQGLAKKIAETLVRAPAYKKGSNAR
jgi:hypothetical protein